MWFKATVLSTFALLLSSSLWAVMLSPLKQGEVLIFPYYGTHGGNITTISISVKRSDAKALKVHFRDRDGEAVLSFNLYLEGNGSWVTALSQVDGNTIMELPDSSCVIPALDDGSGSAIVPLTSGFLEVIEMGTISDPDILDQVNDADCESLASLWAENGQWTNDPSFGVERPKGDLRGSASVINAERGTMYSFVATALSAFSDIQQHTAPAEPLPDLTSAHDEGTEAGATKSITCRYTNCYEDTWSRPIDAVAATLMAHRLSGEYSIEPGVAANAEVVLTFPLRKHNIGDASSTQIRIDLFTFDRSGLGEVKDWFCSPIIMTPPCNAPYRSGGSGSPIVTVHSFNNSVDDYEETVLSDILSEQHDSFFPSTDFPTIPNSGQFDFYSPFGLPGLLTSNEGTPFYGAPVIGLVFQQYTNGFLTDSSGQLIKANYGNALELSRRWESTQP